MTMRTVVVNIKTLACVDTDPKERLQGEEMAGMPTIDNADLLMEQGYDPIYGARPMKRLIQSKLETLCARAIVAGQVHDGQLTVDAENGEFVMKE